MELRNRPTADTPTAEPTRPLDHVVRPEVRHHDADAEFKRGVPRPPGYAPDDTGNLSPHTTPLAKNPELHHDGRVSHESPRHAEIRKGDREDTHHAVIDRPAIHDSRDEHPLDRYGDPLSGADGTRAPLFEGPPRREQARQGWAGDCGLIAALGAVAAHRPGDITSRVREQGDGNYQVTLSEARQTPTGAAPTGRNIELAVTRDLPVHDDDPGVPACAEASDGTAWCPIMEKAFAGLDQTWTAERQGAWREAWVHLCKTDQRDGKQDARSGPAPEGYVRLHQGSTPWEQAEMLTQLTGREAEVRELPTGREEWRINRIIRAELADGKPVLAGSRNEAHAGEVLPHNLEPGHMYEVTGVEKGKIVLRNPWDFKHPEPMETKEFARNMSRLYSTLA